MLAAGCALSAAFHPQPAAADVKPGDVISINNVELAREFLHPGLEWCIEHGLVMEIVPYEDSLLVQIQINPKDVASINVGQLARLKFSAYDFAIHGSLDGDVVFLSADTKAEENGDTFYTTRIKPQREHHSQRPPKAAVRQERMAWTTFACDSLK